MNFRLICEKRLDSLGCAVYSYVVENECTQWFEPSTACANSYQIFKYDALTNMTIAYDNYPIRQYLVSAIVVKHDREKIESLIRFLKLLLSFSMVL